MVKGVAIALFFVVVAAPRGIGAQEAPSPAGDTPAPAETAQEAPGALDVVPVKKGAPAPFLGMLLPKRRFIQLLEAENEVVELRAKLAAAMRTGELVEKALMLRLEQATAPLPWYDSATFNRWLGFVLGVVVTGAVVWGGLEATSAWAQARLATQTQ